MKAGLETAETCHPSAQQQATLLVLLLLLFLSP